MLKPLVVVCELSTEIKQFAVFKESMGHPSQYTIISAGVSLTPVNLPHLQTIFPFAFLYCDCYSCSFFISFYLLTNFWQANLGSLLCSNFPISCAKWTKSKDPKMSSLSSFLYPFLHSISRLIICYSPGWTA